MRPVYDDEDSLDTADVPPGYRKVSDKFRSDGELTARAAEMAAVIVEDPVYLDQLLERARRGALPPAIERMLWEYRYGKPMEMSKMKGTRADQHSLTELSLEELTEMAQKNAEEAQLLLDARARKIGMKALPGGRVQ